MEHALKSYESGEFLGSTLIAGRVINKIMNKIPGKEIEKQIEYLRNNKIITDDRLAGQTILKASKKARNVFTHDLEYMSDPQQSLSLITDTIQIMNLLKDFIK